MPFPSKLSFFPPLLRPCTSLVLVLFSDGPCSRRTGESGVKRNSSAHGIKQVRHNTVPSFRQKKKSRLSCLPQDDIACTSITASEDLGQDEDGRTLPNSRTFFFTLWLSHTMTSLSCLTRRHTGHTTQHWARKEDYRCAQTARAAQRRMPTCTATRTTAVRLCLRLVVVRVQQEKAAVVVHQSGEPPRPFRARQTMSRFLAALGGVGGLSHSLALLVLTGTTTGEGIR